MADPVLPMSDLCPDLRPIELLPSPPECEICGSRDSLGPRKLMAARAPTVCDACYWIWYEHGLTNSTAILAVRNKTNE
jgi:hypothetical protein